jgi:hypothetical protein
MSELQLGVLRPLPEPVGEVVLDAAVRQPAQDEALLPAPSDKGRASVAVSGTAMCPTAGGRVGFFVESGGALVDLRQERRLAALWRRADDEEAQLRVVAVREL